MWSTTHMTWVWKWDWNCTPLILVSLRSNPVAFGVIYIVDGSAYFGKWSKVIMFSWGGTWKGLERLLGCQFMIINQPSVYPPLYNLWSWNKNYLLESRYFREANEDAIKITPSLILLVIYNSYDLSVKMLFFNHTPLIQVSSRGNTGVFGVIYVVDGRAYIGK